MIKAIIFDVGGVLTSRRGRTFVKKYHKKFGMDPEELHLAFHDFYSIDYEFGKKNDDWFLNGIRKNLKNIISKKELRKYWFLCNKVDKGMIRFAKKLKKEYKIGILSNSLPIFTKDLRNKMDLNLFDVVVFSDEVKMKKPNKEIFDYVVKSKILKLLRTLVGKQFCLKVWVN